MEVRIPPRAQVARLRELGPERRFELGCELIELARELADAGGAEAPSGPGGTDASLQDVDGTIGASFVSITDAFEAAGLPYMVVGGLAMCAHGVLDTAMGVEVSVRVPFERRDEVRAVVEGIGGGEVEERQAPQWGQRLVTSTPLALALEVAFTPAQPWYDQEYARRVHRMVRGRAIPFISPEDLVLRKLVNTRLRTKHDLDDAVGIVRAQGDALDLDYLRQHGGVHRVCGRLEEVLELADQGEDTSG